MVSYTLPHPSYEAYTWQIQDEHAPASQPPLIAGEDPPAGPEPPRQLRINGYTYGRAGAATEATPFGQAPPPQSVADLTRWREEWLPEVAKVESLFTTFEPAAIGRDSWPALLEAQDKEYWRVFGGVHRTAVGPARLAFARFVEAYVARFGEARRADALMLLQGFPNRSLDRAAALWDLSRLVREDPALGRMLDQRTSPPPGSPFAQCLAAVVGEFGHTTNNGMLDLPTWGEDPAIPLALVRAYARQRDGRGPREAEARQRATRLRLEDELGALAAAGVADAAALVSDMEMAQLLLPNLEDHNFLADQRMLAASRARWLRIGGWLLGEGKVPAAGDIFYYRKTELQGLLAGGEPLSMTVLEARRAAQALYRSAPPPLTLGRRPETADASGPTVDDAGRTLVRGAAASPGSYRGRARVIDTLEEAETLEDGDILVCRSTTPPWSPFFGVISALVTNSGGVLSHGAVVAREFGIPAVVGTTNATAVIPDGAVVTVDGVTGLVTVEVG
ncbi:MAG: hypothetical protein EXR43_00810 [Dehalococcoidia bacterium]|nr:hypothetical protein [Dehalococcoidia bacterium]